MKLSKDVINNLRALKNLPDSDNIRYKEIIKRQLLQNETLIYLLDNKELMSKDASPDEYFGVNIFPYYMVPDTQHNVQNYICYETSVRDAQRMDKHYKMQQVIFHVLCENGNGIEKNTYFARHDLLAALIIDQFNWTNLFTQRIHLVSDVPTIVDNDYACRTLIFEHLIDNNMAKTRNGVTRMVNHDKTYGEQIGG